MLFVTVIFPVEYTATLEW